MFKEFIILLILILSQMFLCGCTENKNDIYRDDIVITHHELNHRDDWMKIKEVNGIIENNGDKVFTKIAIRVSFFNLNNFLLVEKYDFINNLMPDDNKSFRVVYENYEKFFDEVSYYKVDITDFEIDEKR